MKFINKINIWIFKGNIRLYNIEEDESVFQWSDPFSLHVIKHTGITICKVLNDRDYMVNKFILLIIIIIINW